MLGGYSHRSPDVNFATIIAAGDAEGQVMLLDFSSLTHEVLQLSCDSSHLGCGMTLVCINY